MTVLVGGKFYYFREISGIYHTVCILPWQLSHMSKRALKHPSNIPKEVSDLRMYFDGLRPAKGNVWCKVHLAVSKDLVHFTSQAD